MAHDPRPPEAGGIVSPNYLAVEYALGNVTFPISKRELMEDFRGATALFNGRNVELHDLIKDLHDDYFESEEEFHEALMNQYGIQVSPDEPEPLGTGPEDSWQSRVGPGNTGGPDAYFEPHE